MKKIFSWFCCALLATAVGCAQPKKPSHQIEVWHWMTDRQDALEVMAKKYEQETGIKVKIELFAPSDAYSQKVIAAAQANVLPDIYGILSKKAIVASFIKAGYVADLSADFAAHDSAWEKSMFVKALDVNRFPEGNIEKVKPGLYGVPIDVTNIQLIYNKKLLRKAGITRPPETFTEFVSQIKALKRVGIVPFVSGFGEMWLVECFALNYAFNIMGEEKVFKTFRGEVPYTDPDWIQVFSVFKTLTDHGAFMQGIVTKGNKLAEQDFALGRAAFAFNGSWCVNVYHDMNPSLEYGVIQLPPINSALPMRMWGGAGSSFEVSNSSPNKDKAISFLKWLTAKEQQVFLSEQTNNLPANREALGAIPQVLAEFSRVMETVTHPSVWPLNEDPLALETFVKGIQSIMIAESTPERVAQDVAAVKERQLDKMKR
ncbi:MAG: extracellular solute-binding protein [Candidatus Omnitrophica bacterium]|nr:extracellular solute-binding protein [Candidatus Omnitrophota bacterium]